MAIASLVSMGSFFWHVLDNASDDRMLHILDSLCEITQIFELSISGPLLSTLIKKSLLQWSFLQQCANFAWDDQPQKWWLFYLSSHKLCLFCSSCLASFWTIHCLLKLNVQSILRHWQSFLQFTFAQTTDKDYTENYQNMFLSMREGITMFMCNMEKLNHQNLAFIEFSSSPCFPLW